MRWIWERTPLRPGEVLSWLAELGVHPSGQVIGESPDPLGSVQPSGGWLASMNPRVCTPMAAEPHPGISTTDL